MRAALAEKKANGNGHSSGNGATAPDGTEDHVAKARIEADRIRKAAHAEGVRSAREEARRIVAASRQEAERALASAERKQKELEELEQAIETRRRELEALEQQDQPVTTDPAVTHVNKSANTELEAAAQLREEAEAQLRQAQASREEAEAELLAAQQANEEAQRAQAEAAEARAEAEPVRSETSPAATCGSCSVDPEAIARRVAELLAYSVVQHQRPTEHEQPEEPRLVGRDDPSTGAPPAQTASVKEPPWMKWSDPAKRRKALAGMG
ncbi:hypothetical protein GVX82_04235 [Patescibacteria group bacterium]|nr:hypothetical protein [Patescibacteria group bacterium]